MKDKILGSLKTKYATFGLSDEVFQNVANVIEGNVNEESEIETAVSGVEPLLKSFQSVVDKRVNKFKTENDDLKKQINDGKKNSTNDDDEPKTDVEKAIAKAISPLMKEIETLKTSSTTKDFLGKLKSTLKEKEVPAAYYESVIEGRQFKSDEDVQTWVTKLETGYNKLNQQKADENLGEQGQPKGGNVTKTSKEAVKADIDKYGDF